MFGSPLHSIFICVGSQLALVPLRKRVQREKQASPAPQKACNAGLAELPDQARPSTAPGWSCRGTLARHIDTESWRC